MKNNKILPPTYFLLYIILSTGLHFVFPIIQIIAFPMYLGMTIILLGTAVLLGSLIALIAPCAFFLTMQIIFIPYEEKVRMETFGKEYLQYKGHIRCWL